MEEASGFQPTHIFFLRWWRRSRRSVGKHQESSPAVRAQVERCTGLPCSSAPATVLDVELSIKPNKSMKAKVSDLFCATALLWVQQTSRVILKSAFLRKADGQRGLFLTFLLAAFIIKDKFFPG